MHFHWRSLHQIPIFCNTSLRYYLEQRYEYLIVLIIEAWLNVSDVFNCKRYMTCNVIQCIMGNWVYLTLHWSLVFWNCKQIRKLLHLFLRIHCRFSKILKSSKKVYEIMFFDSIFDSVLFLLKFIFLSTKSTDSLTLKLHNTFQN